MSLCIKIVNNVDVMNLFKTLIFHHELAIKSDSPIPLGKIISHPSKCSSTPAPSIENDSSLAPFISHDNQYFNQHTDLSGTQQFTDVSASNSANRNVEGSLFSGSSQKGLIIAAIQL